MPKGHPRMKKMTTTDKFQKDYMNYPNDNEFHE